MSAIDHPEWNAWLEEVRNAARVRLPDIVRPYVKGGLLAASGGAVHGFSPFRDSSGPSFYVYPEGMWHDFGLSESGDAISFMRKKHGLSFKDALDMCARECSLPTWEEKKRARGMSISDPASLMDLWVKNEAAQRVFEIITAIVHLCWSALPTQIRAYLRDHYRLTDETIDLEKIGWVPAGLWELCKANLPYTDDELYSSGFFYKTLTRGSPDAALAQRILFPYFKDGLARYTIGREFFGKAGKENATVPEWDRGKYKKHLTHSEKFDFVSPHISNELLWGEDTVSTIPHAERRNTRILMCEGITDALMAKQLGYPVLSPVTVSVSNKQAMRLALVTRGFAGLVICNDNDTARDGSEPGKKGAKRTATIVWREGQQAFIATLPRPPGSSKIDVNELVGAWLAEGATIEEAHDRFDREVLSKALTLGEFIISEWATDMDAAVIEKELIELGGMAARLSVLQQRALRDRAIKHFGRNRSMNAPMREAFDRGVKEEAERIARDRAREETAAPEEARADADPSRRALLKSPVIDELGSYERISGEDYRERISSFSVIPLRVIVSEEGFPNRLEVEVVGIDGSTVAKRWIVPSGAWTSKRAFIASFPSERMHFFGTDDEVQAILEIQTGRGVAHLPRLRATSVIGAHEVDGKRYFVLPCGTLDAGGWVEDPPIVFVSEGGSTIEHRLPKVRAEFTPELSAVAREAASALPHLHEGAAIAPMLGWFAALPFKPWLLEKNGGFPFLDVSASPGAGKTSLLAWILWPLFCGVLPGELMSATQTVFAMIKDLASTNALAAILDEFKVTAMKRDQVDTAERFARRSWSGDVETRGRANQTVAHYALTAGVCFAGETGFDQDPATAERGLHVTLNPRWLAGAQGTTARELFGRVRTLPLSGLGPLFQCWALSADREALLARAAADVDAFLATVGRAAGLAPRIRIVLVTLAFGLGALEAWTTSIGAPLTLSRAVALHAALGGTIGVDESGTLGASLADAFDAFLTDAATMASLGLIEEAKHYGWIKGKLFLYLRGIEAARDAWHRARGSTFSSPGMRALKKLAREKLGAGDAYIENADARLGLGEDRHVHGVLVDPKKIPARLECDEFPMKTARSWGGSRDGAGRPEGSGDGGAWGVAAWRSGGRGRDDDEGGGRGGAN